MNSGLPPVTRPAGYVADGSGAGPSAGMTTPDDKKAMLCDLTRQFEAGLKKMSCGVTVPRSPALSPPGNYAYLAAGWGRNHQDPGEF